MDWLVVGGFLAIAFGTYYGWDFVLDTCHRFQAHRRWKRSLRRRPIELPKSLPPPPHGTPDRVTDDGQIIDYKTTAGWRRDTRPPLRVINGDRED